MHEGHLRVKHFVGRKGEEGRYVWHEGHPLMQGEGARCM